jgi:hypothetical protein
MQSATVQQPRPVAAVAAPPSLDSIAAASAEQWRSALEPADLKEVRELARGLRGSCAVPMIQRARGAPREPMSEADIVGLLMLGRSLGLGTMQSLNGIYIVEGKATLAATTMLALVRRSAVCASFSFEESTAEQCVVVARRRGEERPCRVVWDLTMAKRAGVFQRQSSPWQTYPQAMLRARAISDACRMMFSDVLMGLYSTEEMSDADPAPERILASVDLAGTAAAIAASEQPPAEDWPRRLREAAADGRLDEVAGAIKAAADAGQLTTEERAQLVELYRSLRRPAPAQSHDPETGEVAREDEPPAREPGED